MNISHLFGAAKLLLKLTSQLEAKRNLPVLIVENCPYDAEMIASYCENEGATTVVVSTLEAAEAILKSNKFRLLLLDLHFPSGCGLDFAKHIRPRYPKLPVVFVTAHLRDLETLPAGRKWSVIAKGADGGSLLEAIRDALLSANGVNGDVKPGEFFIVIWILMFLSGGLGFGTALYVFKL